MPRIRLDQAVVKQGLADTRSQAESYIRLGKVKVNSRVIKKAGFFVSEKQKIKLDQNEQYVSRAGMKLAGAAQSMDLDFEDKVVLDVGSSTGGFTDYALKHGAAKVIAVDVGTDQLHPKLRNNSNIELHEKSDIRNFETKEKPDIVTVDVSFISLKEVMPAVARLSKPNTQIVVLAKPQFEAGIDQINKGIVKNDTIRRAVLSDLESWLKKKFFIVAKVDSEVAGSKGNRERFYQLRLSKHWYNKGGGRQTAAKVAGSRLNKSTQTCEKAD